jgi:hypothetical protein
MIFVWNAVTLPSRFAPDVGDLVAAVVHRGHVVRAGRDPLDRVAELARGPRAEDLLAVDLQLGAEAAADLGGDGPHAVRAQAEQRGDDVAQEVRHLRRAPDGQAAGAVLGEDGARLDGGARDAVVDDPALDDHVGLGEAGLEVAAAQGPLVRLVRAERLVDDDLVLEGLLQVHDDRERVVLDEDVLGGVDDGVAVVADDGGDRVAHVVDRALGDRPVLGRVDGDAGRHPGRRHRAAGVHVLAGEDGDDVVAGLGRRLVDGHDPRARLGRADERDIQRARQDDVVGVAGAARDEARVLLAAQRAPDVLGRWGVFDGAHVSPPMPRRPRTRPWRRPAPRGRCCGSPCTGTGCPRARSGPRPRSGSGCAPAGRPPT